MSFGEAIKSVFSKYATFSGRARRSEFWYFFLFNFLVSFVLGLIPFISTLSFLWTLAVLIPSLAVAVRRFHDIGKSGWTYLYFLIPGLLYIVYLVYFFVKYVLPASDTFDVEAVTEMLVSNSSSLAIIGILMLISLVAGIIFIVLMARDSEPGENKWGPNPKEQPETEPQNLD